MKRQRFKVPTPDGRWLAAEIGGAEDGDFVIFHTGTPGSRYLYQGLVRECAERKMRVVCASRPGYDGSPRLPGRSHGDNPVDTLAVIEFLGIESAYVIGHSGGAGPALADAAGLGGRVRAVAAAAGFAPRLEMGPSWWEGLEQMNGKELRAIQEGEPALKKYLAERAGEIHQIKRPEDITNHSDVSEWYSRADRECLEDEEVLAFLLKLYSLIGSERTDGWVDDDFALYGDWGFDLADVTAPVTIWQGKEDHIIPVAHAEWLANHVPGATLEMLEEGHTSLLIYRFGDMLEDLRERGS